MKEYIIAQVSPTTGSGSESASTKTVTETAVASEGGVASSKSPTSMFGTLLMPLLLVVVFYFFLIRPQQKKEKTLKKQLSMLQKGDAVVTKGGLCGEVVSINEQKGLVKVKVADKVIVEVTISYIDIITSKESKS